MTDSGLQHSNVDAPPHAGPPETTTPPYGDPAKRALWAVACLSSVAVILVVLTVLTLLQIRLLTQIIAGERPDEATVESVELVLLLVAIGYGAAFVASIITFLMWFHRAYRNLPALQASNLLTTPGWAVGCWFIPILNFFRPYQAAREIVVYSNPQYSGPNLASAVGAPAILKFYWATWIISNVLSRAASRVSRLAEDAESLLVADILQCASSVGLIAAAFMLIPIIRSATRNQQARAAQLLGGNPG